VGKAFLPTLRSPRALIVVAAALAMAYSSSRFVFVGSGLSLIPWGILAMAIAFLATSEQNAKNLGGIFGFTLSLSFLWIDHKGPSTVMGLVVLLAVTLALAIVIGFFAGRTLSWLGWKLRQKFNRLRR
jgi:apolipoprotein N-acyltransferase